MHPSTNRDTVRNVEFSLASALPIPSQDGSLASASCSAAKTSDNISAVPHSGARMLLLTAVRPTVVCVSGRRSSVQPRHCHPASAGLLGQAGLLAPASDSERTVPPAT